MVQYRGSVLQIHWYQVTSSMLQNLFENLIVAHSPVCYRTRRFSIVFTNARHCTIPCASLIQPTSLQITVLTSTPNSRNNTNFNKEMHVLNSVNNQGLVGSIYVSKANKCNSGTFIFRFVECNVFFIFLKLFYAIKVKL